MTAIVRANSTLRVRVACALRSACAVVARLGAIAALALPIVSFAQGTPSQAIYGPVSVKLPSSSLFTFSNSFSAPASVTGPYLLRVQLSAPNSLTSLSFKLNNVQVLALADFAGGKTLVDRTVTAQTNNSYSLQVAGKTIVASFSAPQLVSGSGDIGEYVVGRTIGGVNQIFFIYFMRDIDGVWRLDSM